MEVDGAMLSGQTNPRRLCLAVIAAVVLYVVLDAVAQSLPPHYSPIRDAESDLAVGPFGYIMTMNFLNRGVFSLIFLYALSKAAQTDTASRSEGAATDLRLGTCIFGAWAVGAILLALFPTDVPATPISWHGAIHLIVAVLAFVGGSLGSLILSLQFGKHPALRGAKNPALAVSILSVVLLFVGLSSLTSPVGGLTERLFLGSVLFWQVITSTYLATWTPVTRRM